jgi:hypothetical protein
VLESLAGKKVRVLHFGTAGDATLLHTLQVPPAEVERMERQLALMQACAWSEGDLMFKADSSPFTVHWFQDKCFYLDPAGCSGTGGDQVQLCSKCYTACACRAKAKVPHPIATNRILDLGDECDNYRDMSGAAARVMGCQHGEMHEQASALGHI